MHLCVACGIYLDDYRLWLLLATRQPLSWLSDSASIFTVLSDVHSEPGKGWSYAPFD